jgi:hypothetical protein
MTRLNAEAVAEPQLLGGEKMTWPPGLKLSEEGYAKQAILGDGHKEGVKKVDLVELTTHRIPLY